mmetsp:Transcript_2996/g.6645  ORF Transcript_2996/g.6645 Transcript_2996/m.6645 type:complete len:254 (+) Transcript_2996:470-1231(+)
MEFLRRRKKKKTTTRKEGRKCRRRYCHLKSSSRMPSGPFRRMFNSGCGSWRRVVRSRRRSNWRSTSWTASRVTLVRAWKDGWPGFRMPRKNGRGKARVVVVAVVMKMWWDSWERRMLLAEAKTMVARMGAATMEAKGSIGLPRRHEWNSDPKRKAIRRWHCCKMLWTRCLPPKCTWKDRVSFECASNASSTTTTTKGTMTKKRKTTYRISLARTKMPTGRHGVTLGYWKLSTTPPARRGFSPARYCWTTLISS